MRHDGAPDAAFECESNIDTIRALIADDEAHLREYLETQLKTVWPGLRVVARAANGIEALSMIDDEAPDVVFLDIRMPGLTGLDVAARLADSPSRRTSCLSPPTISMRWRRLNIRR